MITQDNELIAATYSLTLSQKRLVLLALTKVDPKQDSDKPLSVRVSIKEWVAHFGDRNGAYSKAYNALMALQKKSLDMPDQADLLSWIDKAPKERPKDGYLWVHFGYSISYYLRGMDYWVDGYTQYKLIDMAHLPNCASIRLYEELIRFKSTGIRNISLDDLRKRIDPDSNKAYTRFSELNRRVIKPALIAINDKTNITVTAEEHKSGKTVTGHTFRIKAKK